MKCEESSIQWGNLITNTIGLMKHIITCFNYTGGTKLHRNAPPKTLFHRLQKKTKKHLTNHEKIIAIIEGKLQSMYRWNESFSSSLWISHYYYYRYDLEMRCKREGCYQKWVTLIFYTKKNKKRDTAVIRRMSNLCAGIPEQVELYIRQIFIL